MGDPADEGVLVVVVLGKVVVVVVGATVVVGEIVVVGATVVVMVGAVVRAFLTVNVRFFETLPAKFGLPVYTAVMWWVPTASPPILWPLKVRVKVGDRPELALLLTTLMK